MSRTWLLALCLLPLAAGASTGCRASTAGVAFGGYDPLATAPRDTQGTLTVNCESSGTASTVALLVRLDPGLHSGSASARRMRHTSGSADFLDYGLFRDVARTSVWGMTDGVDTMGAALAVSDRGLASVRFTIYGRMPALQDARVGNYADAVRVTILY